MGETMKHLSISTAWDQSRAIIARDGSLMMLVTLALVMLPMALLGLVDPLALESMPPEDYEPGALSSLLSFVVGILGIVAQIAIVALALKGALSIGEALARAFRHTLPVIGAILLLALGLLVVIAPFVMATIGFEKLGQIVDLSATGGRIDPQMIPGSAIILVFAVIALVLFVGIRLSLMVPARVAERVGPIGMIRSSWALTRGHFWRLLGFFLLFGIGIILVGLVYGILVGLIGRLIFGEAEPFTVAALYAGLTAGLLQAAMTVISSTVVARLYAQLAAAPTVPHVEAED